jgi:tRNA nucleotidyltransferase/poly(A) polymerase
MNQDKQQYVVGGAVRDVLLGQAPHDVDFVWVGMTEQEMVDLGFTPVGADFMDFLDQHMNEHALARKERKTGTGYLGFSCEYQDVSLEEDQFRRDFTINQMAVAVEDWDNFTETADSTFVIDPFGGQRDLSAGVIRHVSDAFAEDCVRPLRAARFASRYGFSVAPETKGLIQKMVLNGDLNYLVRERVGLEVLKAFNDGNLLGFFAHLDDLGVTHALFPELVGLNDHIKDSKVQDIVSYSSMLAVLTSHLSPYDVDNVAVSMNWHHNNTQVVKMVHMILAAIKQCEGMLSGDSWVDVLYKTNLLQHKERRSDVADALYALNHYIEADRMMLVLDAIIGVSFYDLTTNQQEQLRGAEIGTAIKEKRKEIAAALI